MMTKQQALRITSPMTARSYRLWADWLVGKLVTHCGRESVVVGYRISHNRSGAWFKLEDGREMYRQYQPKRAAEILLWRVYELVQKQERS